MSVRNCDIAILGGGLAGGLVALALKQARPELSLVLIEQGDSIGGNHVWSFFGTDIGKAGRELLEGMVVAAWPEYTVRFPRYQRRLPTSYYAITSSRFDQVVRERLGESAIMTGVRALACSGTNATLSDGTRIVANAVIDARGLRKVSDLTGGWQKFVGRRFRLTAPHGLAAPIVKDATVAQIDGYRFIYCLPFGEDEIFIEDTYYSDTPALDVEAIRARIDAYIASAGWTVREVLDEERGVLPVVAGGDFSAFWRSSGGHVARAGVRAGLFHAVTSYSLPDAVRYALALAGQKDLGGEALASFSEHWAHEHWHKTAYFRTLAALLLAGAAPEERYRVLERFYRLRRGLIERFYAGRTTTVDKARILAGRPPLPITRAIGVLTGLGRRPKTLSASGTAT